MKKLLLILLLSVLCIGIILSLFFFMHTNSRTAFSLEYYCYGGIVGFQDKGTISSNGKFIYTSRGNVTAKGKLDKQEMNKIKALAVSGNNFVEGEKKRKGSEGIADYMSEGVIVKYNNKVGWTKNESQIRKYFYQYRNKFEK